MTADVWPVWRELREARAAAGLTQRSLAQRAGTSQAAIARYESAVVMPDLDTLARLLLACGRRLELTVTPLGAEERRQLQESAGSSAPERMRRNRAITRLAAHAAAARSGGRIRPVTTT